MMGTDASTAVVNHRAEVVLAPMVRGSELAFRMMIRNYGVSTCFSPMMRAHHVVQAYQKKHRQIKNELYDYQEHEDGRLFLLDSCPKDGPLVIQLCGNCPRTLSLATSAVIEHYREVHKNPVTGIDLNLGCPQGCAKEGGFGAFLAENNPLLAIECVKAMKQAILNTQESQIIHLSCKIRLFDSLDDTIQFAKDLQESGCDILTVHCRRRITKHDGAPDLEAGKALSQALTIPVWINGTLVKTFADIPTTLQVAEVSTLMIAREFLANPRLLHEKNPCPASLAAEYLLYAEQYPPPSSLYIQLHFRWFFRSQLQPLDGEEDYSDWRFRLWTFLARPYLNHLSQFRHVVALYVSLQGCDMPESLLDIDSVPTYHSIRHRTYETKIEIEDENIDGEDSDDESALVNLFQ